MIQIKHDSINKVLGIAYGVKVIEEEIQEDKPEQLWKIGEANTEGYFTLENSKLPKVMTAVYSSSRKILEIKGNITLEFDSYVTNY